MFVNQAELKQKFQELHSSDEKQISAIYSESKRLLIQAPAGYGKTKTMISKIAYLITTKSPSDNKKILALSFSVNAAYKIKKDLANQLPILLNNMDFNINDKLFISNYHGLCRKILKNYGYLFHEKLKDIDNIKSIDDGSFENLMYLEIGLKDFEAEIMVNINESIRNINNGNYRYLLSNWDKYIDIVTKKFIPNNYLPYNAILILTVELLEKYTEIKDFYQTYFEIIIVDEFQDTNILSFLLLDNLIGVNTEVIFIGDSLQRIYGFIGAIPNLIEKCKKKYNMDVIKLDKNYRFKDNPQMLQLEKNIRANSEDLSNPKIIKDALIPLKILGNQSEEATWVTGKVTKLLENNCSQVAILSRSRGKNIDSIINTLKEKNINYFYGLYTDEDPVYKEFHKRCNIQFLDMLQYEKNITKAFLQKFFSKINTSYSNSQDIIVESLLKLLEIFTNRMTTDFVGLQNDDKINLIIDTFSNYALKQNLEYVQENVVIATIHAAKGLEWEYVILPDMEQYVFPSYYGFCGDCNFKLNRVNGFLCNPNFSVFDKNLESKYLEELSVFYVAVTRAKKQVYFSASEIRLNGSGEEKNAKLSCFLGLEGIKFI